MATELPNFLYNVNTLFYDNRGNTQLPLFVERVSILLNQDTVRKYGNPKDFTYTTWKGGSIELSGKIRLVASRMDILKDKFIEKIVMGADISNPDYIFYYCRKKNVSINTENIGNKQVLAIKLTYMFDTYKEM